MLVNQLYHIYNRGNNRQAIFLKRANYLYFLEKIRMHISQYTEVLCYCLMPNHFYLLIATGEDFDREKFSNSFRVMLSSYTRAINKQEGRVGSLFQQNSKFKIIENSPETCFHYIHQNPLKANLVTELEGWEYSSFRDYCRLRNGTLCNKELAYQLLEIPVEKQLFYNESYRVICDEIIEKII